jgi:ribosomal protein S18 acetylase RimI-like enzyme
MELAEARRAIRNLLDERHPADALSVYYAYHHSEAGTQIVVYPPDAGPRAALAYVAFSRTGIDLFRPFVTLRLPIDEMKPSVDAIYAAMQPGSNVILHASAAYLPLLQALFDIDTVEHMQLYVLNRDRFEPIINVLVSQETAHNELPRFVIRHDDGDELKVVASAALNWQTPFFADLAVHVEPRFRRRAWGRSVLAAMVHHLISSGRTPLYRADKDNQASIELARSVGFEDSRVHEVMIQGILKSRP